jgi:hypothetical protein
VKPGDLAALTTAMSQLLDDEAGQREMCRRALEQAHLLSWERAAEIAYSALAEALVR